MRGLILGAAALAAVLSSAAEIGQAAGAPQHATMQSRASVRALEPGFTGQLLYRNDNFRTGQNLAESVLTPSTVTTSQFGLQFTDAIDAYVYAQPLYAPAVAITGLGTHNVVYVATENDSVYAFDADAAGLPLWQTSFIDPANGITAVPSSDVGASCEDLVPIIGITATPVIDSNTGTLYVVSKVKLGPGSYQQQLHALDITTGLERPNSPVTIAASVSGSGEGNVNGTISFNPLTQHDRPALTLANGVVYLSFASHCDITPYNGWILGYDETTLAQEVVYNTTPNGSQGGIWEAGCGPGVDTNGNLIAITGNGTFDTVASPVDYGDSFLSLTPGVGTTGTMSVSSFFTPLNEMTLDDDDQDMGSGGNLLLPDQPGPNPHLVIGIGKVGEIYLVNRDSMGGFNASGDQMVQELPSEVGGMFSTPAYWQWTVPNVGSQNMIYTIGAGDVPKMFVLANGMIQTPPASAGSIIFGYPGASPVISANGTSGGIMWAINSAAYRSSGPAILYAFDATNLQTELYDSTQNSSDYPGPAVKFTLPTVANGSVYMGTETQLAVFGLFPGGQRPSPTATATQTPTASGTPTPTASPTPTVAPTPIAATLKASPKELAFSKRVVGSQSDSAAVKLNNTSKMPVILSPPTISSSDFVVTSNNCPAQLQPGTFCTLQVAFIPTATGKRSATLQVNSNAESGRQMVVLSGKGVAPTMKASPKALVFGKVSTDSVSSPLSITLSNSSPAPITFTTAPAATPPFNVTANTCDTLAPNGGTCTISVEFAPHSRGNYKGTLELRDNAADNPQHIKLTGSSR
jgi:Abnormal spindle-like microcephaly-assoc'd, ASPM-SPD-2-Hydin